jgi:hypothetical protein
VEPLVERVRDTFLDGLNRSDTLTTRIELSSADAHLGVVVPLQVPVRGTCSVCGGRGETWAEPCGACLGSGNALTNQSIRFALPPGVADGARFWYRVRSPYAAELRVEVQVAVRSV